MLTAALNRQNCLFLKDCHIRASLVSGLGLPWHFSRIMLKGTWCPGCGGPLGLARCHRVKAGSASPGAAVGSAVHTPSAAQGLRTRQSPGSSSAPSWLASTLASRCPRRPCLSGKRKAAGSGREDPPGLRRRHVGSVAIEFLQDCCVGVFKQPLLGGRGGVADVHEDPVVAFAAIHAAAADGVVQALVLQNT